MRRMLVLALSVAACGERSMPIPCTRSPVRQHYERPRKVVDYFVAIDGSPAIEPYRPLFAHELWAIVDSHDDFHIFIAGQGDLTRTTADPFVTIDQLAAQAASTGAANQPFDALAALAPMARAGAEVHAFIVAASDDSSSIDAAMLRSKLPLQTDFKLVKPTGERIGGCTGQPVATPRLDALSPNSTWELCEGAWFVELCACDPVAFHLPLLNPASEVVKVEVDGVDHPSMDPRGAPAWSFDVGENAVVFTGLFAPAPGARIDVTYLSVCR